MLAGMIHNPSYVGLRKRERPGIRRDEAQLPSTLHLQVVECLMAALAGPVPMPPNIDIFDDALLSILCKKSMMLINYSLRALKMYKSDAGRKVI